MSAAARDHNQQLFARLLAPKVGLMKPPILWCVFWVFFAYASWLASPYFAYYLLGVPKPQRVTQLVGDVRFELSGTYGRFGYAPPAVTLFTKDGKGHTLHCGYVMHPDDCVFLLGLKPFNETTVNHHWYFGILQIQTAQQASNVNNFGTFEHLKSFYLERSLPERVWRWLMTWVFLTTFWIVSVFRTLTNNRPLSEDVNAR